MNKEELGKYVDGLDVQTEIIVITTPEQASVIPKRCERVDAGGKVIWLLRQVRKGICFIAVAWVLQVVDVLPKPQAVFLTAKEKIEYVVKHVDYDFPYIEHDNHYQHVAFEYNGTTHYLPPSGFSPDALAQTGSIEVGNTVG